MSGVEDNEPTDRLAGLPTWRLAQAAARSHRLLHERLVGAGISGYEYRVLAVLVDVDPDQRLTQAVIGRRGGLDARDVTHTVRALESRRLLARRPDPADARTVLVRLTPAGRRLLDRLDTVVQAVQAEVLEPLTAAQRRTFVHLIGRLG